MPMRVRDCRAGSGLWVSLAVALAGSFSQEMLPHIRLGLPGHGAILTLPVCFWVSHSPSTGSAAKAGAAATKARPAAKARARIRGSPYLLCEARRELSIYLTTPAA